MDCFTRATKEALVILSCVNPSCRVIPREVMCRHAAARSWLISSACPDEAKSWCPSRMCPEGQG